jgi:hypothetical protein
MYNFFLNLSRFIFASLSYPYSLLFNNNVSKNIEKKVLKSIFNYINSSSYKNNHLIKTETHKIFNLKLLDIIKNKKIDNFLNNKFIQKIFFVHNRFYIVVQLISLKLSSQWHFWKKIINENSVGKPIRFFFYPWSSGNLIRQAYHLKKFNDWKCTKFNKIDFILEFGGGYGCMANLFKKISNKNKYIIFDTKVVSLLQYYYLAMNGHPVSFENNNRKNILLVNNSSKLRFFINHVKCNNRLLIMNWSFSEIPINQRIKYEDLIFKFNYIIISFQDKFENINNSKYFDLLKKKLESKNYNIHIKKIHIMKLSSLVNHYYFFGYKND